ncbi:hypothetical protein TNCV_180891 [Trichonephila clavipes]|nr:hypothetical protein TNCV_180891 [Trichonephila clavipes]
MGRSCSQNERRPYHLKSLQCPTNWHTKKGRPNLRWIDGLEKIVLVLRTRNWRTLAGRKLAWKRFLEKAKTHPGLSSH